MRARASVLFAGLLGPVAACVDNKLTPADACPPSEPNITWHTPSASCTQTPAVPTVTDPWTVRRLSRAPPALGANPAFRLLGVAWVGWPDVGR